MNKLFKDRLKINEFIYVIPNIQIKKLTNLLYYEIINLFFHPVSDFNQLSE